MCSLFACVDARRCSGVRGQENRRRQHQNQLSPAVLCDNTWATIEKHALGPRIRRHSQHMQHSQHMHGQRKTRERMRQQSKQMHLGSACDNTCATYVTSQSW